jgi:hypothetical protein
MQRMTSDGYPFTDREDGKPEIADRDHIIYKEAVLLRPEDNNGKWYFNLHSGLSWEVSGEYVQDNQRRIFHQ